VLANLQPDVLAPEGYRRLIELLGDAAGAKFLAHAKRIDDDDIRMVADIPAALREVVIPIATSSAATTRGLSDGLNFLVGRGLAPSFEALVAELQSLRQPQQLSAHLRKLVWRQPSDITACRMLSSSTTARRGVTPRAHAGPSSASGC
jgi:hypothetical protein